MYTSYDQLCILHIKLCILHMIMYIWEVPEMGGLAVLIPLKVAGSSSVQADVAVNKTLIT